MSLFTPGTYPEMSLFSVTSRFFWTHHEVIE